MGWGGTDGCIERHADGRTDRRIPPMFYRILSPSGPLPKNRPYLGTGDGKRENGTNCTKSLECGCSAVRKRRPSHSAASTAKLAKSVNALRSFTPHAPITPLTPLTSVLSLTPLTLLAPLEPFTQLEPLTPPTMDSIVNSTRLIIQGFARTLMYRLSRRLRTIYVVDGYLCSALHVTPKL